MDHAHIVEQNHVALRLTFATLMIIAGWLVYAGVRVTLFNIPMRILGLTIQHELSLALWVFGSITIVVLMVIILDHVYLPRRKMVWEIK